MLPKNWFLHIEGVTVGPLEETSVCALLQTGRVHFSDFGWRDGMGRWARLSDLAPFSKLMPEIPDADLPGKAITSASPTETSPKSRSLAQAALAHAPRSTPASGAILHMIKPQVAPRAEKDAEHPKRPERVTLEGHVIFEDGSRHKILNLSESGVFVRLPEDVPILGTEVRITLNAKALGKPLDMTGVLIREEMNEGENAVAIEFTKVNPVHRRILRSYVDSKS